MEEKTHRRVGPAEEVVGLALALAGAVTLVLGMIKHSRLLRALGFVLALAGGGVFARHKIAVRGEKIEAAENVVRDELAGLDPVARAQVLADIAHEQM
jgi:hypothetical protein